MKIRPYIVSLVLIAILACAIDWGWLGDKGQAADIPRAGQSGFAEVERVVDGDTVILSENLGYGRVVGVDTPETVQPGAPVECFGPQASAYTKRVLAPGKKLRYRVAVEPVDRYGRSLVYLWLPDGRFFNAMLIRNGYATVLTIPPNTHYASLFERLEEKAARARRGLWGRC